MSAVVVDGRMIGRNVLDNVEKRARKLLENGERAVPSVKTGDRVMYGKYSGTEIEIKGISHLIVRENELLGLVQV